MRILVIEDYTPIRNSVTERLQEDDYVVDSTATGAEGLWYAENHEYDVILLDLMLPNIDGLSLLKKLRSKNNKTPVIIISARDSVKNKIEGLDAGADDYLIKPFSLDEMLARVRVQIRKCYSKNFETYQVGEFLIDFTSKRVMLKGDEIILTKREYGILEYLAYRAGEVVSRQEIWNHVYHEYGECSTNAVDVYVGYLRKKLDPDGTTPLIHTRRGQGYYLELSENQKSNEKTVN